MYKTLMLVFIIFAGFFAGCSQKRLEDMKAIEVAQNPAAYGFVKGGSMEFRPIPGSGYEPTRDDQWTKKTADGKLLILTIHYDKDGKLLSAKWGGF